MSKENSYALFRDMLGAVMNAHAPQSDFHKPGDHRTEFFNIRDSGFRNEIS